MSAPCAQVGAVVRFYHLSETSNFKEFTEIVTPDIKWRWVVHTARSRAKIALSIV